MNNATPPPSAASDILYCANHPKTETALRCNRCEKLICMRCAVLTPTGYRCKDCLRGQQKAFETAIGRDFVLAFLAAGILSFLGSWFIPNFLLFAFILSPLAGGVIAEVVRFLVQKRRSKRLFQVAAAGALAGTLPLLGISAITLLVTLAYAGVGGIGAVLPLAGHVIYAGLVTTTTYYRLAGLHFRY